MQKTILAFIFVMVSYYNLQAQYVREPLIEEFSNIYCGVCEANNPAFYSMLNSCVSAKFNTIVYHSQNYPTDILYQFDLANGNVQYDRGVFYSSWVTGTPDVFLNGAYHDMPSTVTCSNLTSVNTFNSPIQITLNESYNLDTLKVTASFVSNPLTDCKLYIAIVEDVTFATPPAGAGAATFFPSVCRFLVNSGQGVNITAGSISGNVNYYTYIPSNLVKPNLKTIAWIQNNTTKEVLQSLTSNSLSGAGISQNLFQVSIEEANNTSYTLQNNTLTIENEEIKSIQIFNLQGQLLLEKNSIFEPAFDILGFENKGMYILKVTTTSHKNLIIKHIF